MDTQIKQTGGAGSFSRVNTAAPSWLERNKSSVVPASVAGAVILLGVIAGSIWATNQSTQSAIAFSSAMDIYDAPIKQPGQPAIPNVKAYNSAADRAHEANPLFEDVAARYSLFKAGANARYFAGLTDEDMGKNAAAEADLKKAAASHDDGLAALAKMALASLYTSTGRANDAATLYRNLIDHPTSTVSANAARLALAASEESTHPQEARELYAKIKDSDKTTAAGQIATQKLNGK